MLPIRNVVIILMESFAARYVGALVGTGAIMPRFDRLSREGLLFTPFLSNDTHTHQSMSATMPEAAGFGVIEPAGGEQTVALAAGDCCGSAGVRAGGHHQPVGGRRRRQRRSQ